MYTGVKAHRRRKTSKEERICPVCTQGFKKAEHLARHLRSHTKEKPFNCPVCDKAFARQDTLLRHSRSHPTGDVGTDAFYMPQSISSQGDPEVNLSQETRSPDLKSFDTCQSSGSLQLTSLSIPENIMTLVSPPNSTSIDKPTPNFSAGDETSYPTQVSPLASLFPLEAEDTWRQQQSNLLPGPWDYQIDNRDLEALLTGDDFDLDAVNLSLLYATSDHVPTTDTIPGLDDIRPTLPEFHIDTTSTKKHASAVQKKWHTFSEMSVSGQMTPVVQSENNFIDESYRKRLAERLQQRVQHGILPSTPFLDLCVQAYFSKFHPLFPVVHMPTFRPGIRTAVLLLSICSAGSLLIGSPRAVSHGISMFERLNKATLSSWDTYVTKAGGSSLIALQASIIGQTFGLVMGRPKDLAGIEMFHGTLIAWARKGKLFNLEHPEYNLLDLDGQTLEDTWVSWAQIEVKKRIVMGLHIHDAELAKIHHHEPLLRHGSNRLPNLSSSELFAAPSAAQWKVLMTGAQIKCSRTEYAPPSPSTQPSITNQFRSSPIPGDFALCGMLQSISALVCEEQGHKPNFWSSKTTKHHDLLKSWYHTYHSPMAGKPSWLCLMMLWHSVFMNPHSDFNALECALGREGYDVAQRHIPYARNWVRSMDAKRCLLHAMLIQKNFESLPAGVEPAIHVPMCLYHCGLVWACFMCFGNSNQDSDPIDVSVEDQLQFSELRLHGIDGIGAFLEQTGGLQPAKLATGSLFRVIDLLQRISHWKISQSLASTLLALVEETQEFF
ncbi:hypothetical protein N7488_007208 [Penicillium malachiteum]|nr:hypothetical protein N7488_007208 [Penicillium malachiteum]